MNPLESRLKELRKLCEAATPGPWKADQCGDVCSIKEWDYNEQFGGDIFRMIGTTPTAPDNPDSLFIAAANPETVKLLIETVEKLNRALKVYANPNAYAGAGDYGVECWITQDDTGATAIEALTEIAGMWENER